MMKRILIVLILAGFTVHAQQAAMNFSLEKKINDEGRNSSREISLFVKGNMDVIRRQTENLGGTFKYAAGNIAAIRLPLNKVKELAMVAEIKSIQNNDLKLQPMNDQMIIKNHVMEVQNGFSLPQSYNGEGVVMGIIDEGIDYTHPDFRDEFGNTRIKFLWDQSLINLNSATQPQPYGYGKEYIGNQIDTASQHHDGQFGHGTHVAGIAVGNGLAVNNYKGVAPKADMIIVKMNLNQPDNDFLSNLVDAIKYIFDHADAMGEPAVINISLGTYFGSHDAKDIQAEAINNLITSAPGHVVVCAAGNAGTAPLHLGYYLNADTMFTWMQFSSGSIYIQAWVDSADFANAHFSIGVDRRNHNCTELGRLPFTASSTATGTFMSDEIISGGNRIGTVNSFIQNWGDRYSFEYEIIPDSVLNTSADSSRYFWKLLSTGGGRMDAWSFDMVFDNLPDTNSLDQIRYYKKPDTEQTIVSSFSCSDKVITVGSYINRNYYTNANFAITRDTTLHPGQLSTFSSKGPTRDGRIKPDITATGEWLLSCGTQNEMNILASTEPEKVAAGKKHKRSSGTSMAAPVVAGIAALYLQKNPQATWLEVKTAILNCADHDDFTGDNLPDNHWGYGKINGYNVVKGCTVGIDQLNDYSYIDFGFYPNPSADVVNFHYDLSSATYKNASLEIKNTLGEIVNKIFLKDVSNSIDIQGELQSGIYIGALVLDGKTVKTTRLAVIK
jgi:subtilisin family serine protease